MKVLKGDSGKSAQQAETAPLRNQVTIRKASIRRLARRCGARRISACVYRELEGVLRTFLENILRDAIVYTDHARRRTVMERDIVCSVQRRGRKIYGVVL